MNISELVGQTLTKIQVEDNYEIHFYTSEGYRFVMYHEQGCCEGVWLEEVIG